MSSYTLPIGPVHVVLEEPIYFKLRVEGETVVGLDINAGHVHRGIEFLAMQRNFYQNLTLTERVCSLCSNNHPFTYCMAIEKIAGIDIPERAEYLRTIADEIKRISSHLFNVGLIPHIIGFDSLFMHAMELRETMQDLKESIFGNRMNLSVNTIGGVRYDISDEQVQYILKTLDNLKKPLEEITGICKSNASIRRRTEGVGILPEDKAIVYGVTGPVARGSGVANDVRVDTPYAAYDKHKVNVVTKKNGDVFSRQMVRLGEAVESINIIEQCLKNLPDGPTRLDYMPDIPVGEAIAKSEAPRGELIYYARSNGTDIPERIKWRVPTYQNWEALNVMMQGCKIADVPVVIGSIDPCISCTER
ncbi:hydrogenase large subunit [Bacillus sp. 1NLA3E]|uniref:hydrogenase large subunit n=1 Tax=Bacillus sp. 1NLA3E TaxID=666686 RepID=UPI000247F1A6|nr:nickel-dependent hydrogenase large subunit [Bacillus sp. 1NLA3E]AGK54029.1 carbon monoxide-induced hydrogenase large subunit [Bacillus sp. 1NLA3E]